MITSLVTTTALLHLTGWTPAERILATVLVTTPIWVAVTYLTSPVDWSVLEAFYRKVRPASWLWGSIAKRCPEVPRGEGAGRSLAGWLLGALGLYAAMFAVGKLVLLEYRASALALGACVILGILIRLCFRGRRSPLVA